jgi:TonB family protein
VRPTLLWTVCLAALGAVLLDGCAAARRPPPVAAHPAAAQPPDPFDDTSTSFTVQGARFAPGETAIVKVCVTPEGSIASADVIGSSGDKRFDDYALVWARQVRLRAVAQGVAQGIAKGAATQTPAPAQSLCGPVRVEIRPAGMPAVLSDHSSALS